MPTNAEQTITQAKAARRYGVSEKTVRKWRRAGLIRGSRIGPRLVLVHVEDIERLLASASAPAQARAA
ncbi:MAG: helix-turn-helix domain-containing protein [Sandaracinaceae bacterium]|nr:helix-turn-helix domain-containing protein [Sandaracinaceae bacterium]